MDILRLAYLSKTNFEFTNSGMLEFSIQCRKNNHKNNITSVLFYGLEVFIQVIEGECEAVKELYSNVKNDDRHEKVILLFEEFSIQRNFPHWSMRLLALEETRFDRILEFNQFLHNYKEHHKVNLNSQFIHQIKKFSSDDF